VLLCLKKETESVSKVLGFFKELDYGQSKKKGGSTIAVNFSHALFSLLSTHDDLVMEALVWFHMVQFRAIWFGRIQFRSSQTNLR